MACEFRLTRELDPADVLRLYAGPGWWEPGDDPGTIPKLLAGSFRVAAAFDGGRLVGMARAVSDGASDAYIQDVVVEPDRRGQGIGSELVRMLVAELRKAGVSWIGLVGAPGTERFYRKLGFSPLAGHVPMRYTGGEDA